jgi:hypothetical protein
MADLTSTTVAANYNKFTISQSDAGREIVVKAEKENMVHADLLAVIRQLSLSGGDGTGTDSNGPDAGTIAAFGTANGSDFASGVTDEVFFRVQTTGTLNLTEVSGVTLTAVAVFAPRF